METLKVDNEEDQKGEIPKPNKEIVLYPVYKQKKKK